MGPGCLSLVAAVCNDAEGTGMEGRLRGDEEEGKTVVPGVYVPTFWTCSLHLTSSMGVRTREAQAPEIPPATTSPLIERASDDCERKRLFDLSRA